MSRRSAPCSCSCSGHGDVDPVLPGHPVQDRPFRAVGDAVEESTHRDLLRHGGLALEPGHREVGVHQAKQEAHEFRPYQVPLETLAPIGSNCFLKDVFQGLFVATLDFNVRCQRKWCLLESFWACLGVFLVHS